MATCSVGGACRGRLRGGHRVAAHQTPRPDDLRTRPPALGTRPRPAPARPESASRPAGAPSRPGSPSAPLAPPAVCGPRAPGPPAVRGPRARDPPTAPPARPPSVPRTSRARLPAPPALCALIPASPALPIDPVDPLSPGGPMGVCSRFVIMGLVALQHHQSHDHEGSGRLTPARASAWGRPGSGSLPPGPRPGGDRVLARPAGHDPALWSRPDPLVLVSCSSPMTPLGSACGAWAGSPGSDIPGRAGGRVAMLGRPG